MVLLLYIDVPGLYTTENEHSIEENQILNDAISSLNDAAIKFSIDAISDAKVRLNYANNIKRMVTEVQQLVNTKKISVKEAAEFCYEMRKSDYGRA